MKQRLEKLIEMLLVNLVWNILKIICVSVIAFALVFINAWLAYGTDHYILSIALFLCLVIVFFALRTRFGPQHPKFRWDVIHGENRYVLSFRQREIAEYAKTIEAIPLRDDIKSFPAGEYV